MQSDRRLFPRFLLRFPVQAHVDTAAVETCFAVAAVNISQKSVEIACDQALIDAITAQQHYPYSARLVFRLPEDNYTFDITLQVVNHRRLSQHQYRVAMLFLDHREEDARALDNYFANLPIR